MEAQDIFNKVWNHFVVNKSAPSIGDDGKCKYRKSGIADDPCRCAAGLFIPDDQYTHDMDFRGGVRIGAAMHRTTSFGKSEAAQELLPHVDLLERLQKAHDNATVGTAFHADIELNLLALIEEFKLGVPA